MRRMETIRADSRFRLYNARPEESCRRSMVKKRARRLPSAAVPRSARRIALSAPQPLPRSPRRRKVRASSAVLILLLALSALAATDPVAELIGTWKGTSPCTGVRAAGVAGDHRQR